MKKSTLILILLAMFVVSCLALTACHTCEFGEWEVATPATCTQIGQEKRVCECGEFEVRDIPATGHTFGEWTIVENSTCTELGQEQRVCACGEKEVRDIALAKHTYGNWIEVKAATCTEAGIALRSCTCGVAETKVLEATGHSHEAVVTQPTCTEQGYTTHTCYCGDSFVDTYVDALGHTEGSIVVENNVDPTCTVDGSYDNVVYCTVCKAELSRQTVTVDALGHTAGSVVIENNVAPKCTVDGSYDNVVYCTVCDAELSRDTVVVPALGHTEGSVVVENNADPTCTVDGSYENVVYCTVCKAELSRDAVTVDALDHDEVPHDAKAPTCTEIGWDAYVTCSRCDYTTYVEIPTTGHSHEAVVTAPTCLEKGYTTHTCHCGNSYVDTYVDALGHNFQESDNCSNCGQNIASVAVTIYNMSATADDDVRGYVIARPVLPSLDKYYDAYIKGTGTMKNYTSSSAPFYVDGYKIVNAYIECGVTSIGDYAFYHIPGGFRTGSSLISVTMPDSITTVGDGAFESCGNLTSITIPASVISIGSCAFNNCTNLTNITIEGSPEISFGVFDGTAYYNNTNNWEDKVLYIGNCLIEAKTTIESCTIKEGTTVIADEAFSGCSSLTRIKIPSSVTIMGRYAFSGCDSLDKVEISDVASWCNLTFDNTSTTPLEHAKHLYINGEEVTNLIIPASVTSIPDYAFYNCSSITSVTFEEGSQLTSIGYCAFESCTNLKNIVIPNSVTNIDDRAFFGCSSLESISLPFVGATSNGTSKNTHFGYIFGASSYYANGSRVPESLKTVIITGGTKIADRAFYNCINITSITIPSSVTSIAQYAFYGCSSLTSITLPFVGSSISGGNVSFGYIFGGTDPSDNKNYVPSTLKNVVITGGTSIGLEAFFRCSNIESVILPSTLTSISEAAFSGCDSLISITFEGDKCWYVTSKKDSQTGTFLNLADASQNANYLRNTYSSHFWYATDHNYVPVITDPTCTEQGYTTHICRCGDILGVDTYVDATGHSHEAVVTAPTCTKQGYTTHTCHCGDSFVDTYVDELGHTEGSVVVENNVDPTCTVDGSYDNVVYCTVCKAELSRDTAVVPAHGHTEGSVVVENNVAPKCTVDGSYDNVVYCTVCDAELSRDTVTVDALGHAEVPHVAKAPTCTAIGWDAYVTCSRCEYSTYVKIPATGHSYQAVVTAPTCTKRGYTTHTCHCGSSYVDSYVDARHNYVNHICERCGDVYYSKGLKYTLSGTYYIVSGIGTCTDTDIVIPARYNSTPVKSIGESAFSKCSRLTSITIPKGVTSIGNSAFYNCSKLTSITIPDSVTSIGNDVFYGCSSLTSLTIPEFVTSIGNYAFYGCKSLTSITIPSSVTSIGWYAFADCTSLTSITIPIGVTSIGNDAFKDCSSLTSITIPSSVTSIGRGAFYQCTSLTSITLPFVGATLDGTTNTHFKYIFNHINVSYELNCVPSSLKTVVITGGSSIGDDAFKDCSKLTSITIPDSVTSIGNDAFYGCSSLTSLIIPEGVTSIGEYAFYGCSSLTSLIIPEGVTSIGEYAFRYCTSLTSITIPDGVTSIGSYAFSFCTSLISITIPDSVTSIVKSAFEGCSKLTSITIPDSVTSIGNDAFRNCSSLTSLIIPEGVTSIGNYAFDGCSSLTSITIPDSVTSIGNYAFYGCKSLTSITIPEGVTSIGKSAFYNCKSLTSITIPSSVTSIGNYAFYGCSSLTSLIIPEGVTSIGEYAFSGCTRLTDVYYTGTQVQWYSISIYASNEALTNANIVFNYHDHNYVPVVTAPTCTEQGYTTYTCHCGDSYVDTYVDIDPLAHDYVNYVCERCGDVYYSKGLKYTLSGTYYIVSGIGTCTDTDVVIPATYEGKPVKEIGGNAFSNSKSLTSITIPNSVTSIGENAFYNCISLTSITIPDSVTSIGENAFYNCNSLTNITIPSSVTSIGERAFQYCSRLTSITIPSSVTSIGERAFQYCSSLTSITIPSSVTSIGERAFQFCSSLTSITIPDSVTSIGDSAFASCTSLTSITIPDSVTSIGSGAFSDCSSLQSITLPFVGAQAGKTSSDTYQYPLGYIFGTSSYIGATAATQYYYGSSTSSRTSSTYYIPTSLKQVTITGGNILYGAFYGCSSLTSVTLGSGVTSIGYSAFSDCTGLTNITIPDSVTSISGYAFYECTSLTDVYYTGTQEQWGNISIGSSDAYLTNANIVFNYTGEENYPQPQQVNPKQQSPFVGTQTCKR